MKKLAIVLLCAALLVGCGADSTAASASVAQAGSEAPASVSASMPQADAAADGAASAAVQPESARSTLSGLAQTAAPGQRPAAVMISNRPEAAVQWGIGTAEVVLEGITEGKNTNLCLWYPSLAAMPKVGPVTEGKDLYWQLAMSYNSILVQRGGSTYAKNLLNCYSYQPLDALNLGVNCFDYDSGVDADEEYCWYTSGSSLGFGMEAYGLSTAGSSAALFDFSEAAVGTASATRITVVYSDTASTQFGYDAASGAWMMQKADGTPQLDANTGAQAAFANVFVLECASGIKDDKYTRNYDLTAGTGTYYTKGTCQSITWKKGDVAEPLQLFAADGSPLSVAPGKSYIGILGGFAGQSTSSDAVLPEASPAAG